MANSSTHKWWYLFLFVALVGGTTWSRTRSPWLAAGTALATLFIGGSWLAGHNAVSAYTHVLDRTADAVHASQETAAYQVRRLLTRFRYEPSVEGLAELALTQLKQIEGHFRHFEKSLAAKLNQGELTYDRYHTAGAQAYNGVMENLNRAASLIEQLTRARSSELVTKLETVFSKNDEALSGFEKINAALDHLSGGSSPQRLQDAISDLEVLSKQAQKYVAGDP